MAAKINFTIENLNKIPVPTAGRTYTYDTKRVGLCLCVTSSGSRSFYHYRKVGGQPQRNRVGGFPELTIDQARRKADQLNVAIADGKNPMAEKRAERGEMTLGELFTVYLNTYAKPHKKTWEEDEATFKRYLDDWRGRKLSKIERKHIATHHAKVGADNGIYAANRMLALLSTVFNFAPDYGFTGSNPCKGVKRFKEQERERFIQADEMPRFLAALDADESQSSADFFRLCLYTGQRKDNVMSMAWADVNFGRRTWTLPGMTTKNGDPLTVDLTDQALEALRRRWAERKDNHPYVFPGRGATGHLAEPKEPWKRICERAKLTDLHIHDLRRTAGSWMAIGGASLITIGAALGHKSQRATAVYARLNRQAPAAAMQTATAAIAAMAPVRAQEEAKTA